MEISKENFLKLPQSPGVYIFWDVQKPIYIGKSVNLKSRLVSYLNLSLAIKTKKMISEAKKLTFLKVNSELEALLLESQLIKKHKPKYNTVLKDDKHPLYIIITKDEFPRVLTSRKLPVDENKLSAAYGPFPSSLIVKKILKLLRKIFPYSDHKLAAKPCFYSRLGLCKPCPSYINNLENKKEIKKLKLLYLRNIRNIKYVLTRKFSVVRRQLEKQMINLSKQLKYEEAGEIRDKIKMLDYVTQSKISAEKFIENPNLLQDIRYQEIADLANILKINNFNIQKLERIECYDVSHLMGACPTASMVVAINGEMEISFYRHFNIRQKKGQSDYDSMKELAKRRAKYFKKWGLPNLIIIDGGIGQIRIFNKSINKYKIPIIGIAKNPDRLVFLSGAKLKINTSVLNLVQRLRNEAHRFARKLHQKQILKILTQDKR